GSICLKENDIYYSAFSIIPLAITGPFEAISNNIVAISCGDCFISFISQYLITPIYIADINYASSSAGTLRSTVSKEFLTFCRKVSDITPRNPSSNDGSPLGPSIALANLRYPENIPAD